MTSTAFQVLSSPSALAELLADLARTFRALRLRWYLFGAQAAILHGSVRLTADVDVTVELGTVSTTAVMSALERAGFDSRIPDDDDFVARTRVLPLVHRATRVPVDIVLAGPGLEELFLDRAEQHTIGGISIPVLSAEDLVALKVLAGRSKDLDDVSAVIQARGADLDLGRVRETLTLLEKGLDRADLLPELERLRLRARRRRDL